MSEEAEADPKAAPDDRRDMNGQFKSVKSTTVLCSEVLYWNKEPDLESEKGGMSYELCN